MKSSDEADVVVSDSLAGIPADPAAGNIVDDLTAVELSPEMVAELLDPVEWAGRGVE